MKKRAGSKSSGRPKLSKVLDALHRLYAVHDIETFPTTLMAVAEELVPCVAMSFDSVNLQTGEAINRFDRPVALPAEDAQARWQAHCHEHPGIAYLKNGGTASVFSFTDFLSQRQFEETAFHNEITKPCGITHQLGSIFPVPGYIVGMAMNRDGDFSRDDRELVELLHPHFAQAFQNALLFSSLRGSPEIDFRGWRNHGFTKRECEVLRWLVEGKRNREIGTILNSATRTIDKHVQNIFGKLGVETRGAAASEARRLLQRNSALPFLYRPDEEKGDDEDIRDQSGGE